MKIYIVIIISFYCLSLQAINRYVAKTGNNNNAGTYSAPFLTIQKAADIVQPGDTVIVRDGVYSSTITNYGSEIAVVRLVRSGNSSGWITFRAENKGKAIIDGASYDAEHGFMIDNGASYIKIQGFEIRYISLWAIPVFPNSSNLIFRDNNIHHIGNICTTTSNGICAINLMRTNNVIIERNLIHDIGRLDPAEGCSMATNYKWMDHGIYLDGANYVTIDDNIFYSTHAGWAVHLFNKSGYPITGISILNNTFAFGKWATGFIILSASVSNTNIQNNIFYQSEDAYTELNPNVNPAIPIITENSTYSGVTINHNLAYRGSGRVVDKIVAGVTTSNNIELTDPKMVNPAGFDFRLQSTSPSINAGVNVGLTTDFSGNAIVGLPDIGAYESQTSGVTSVSQPSGIVISSPVTGDKFTAPTSVTINATANGISGLIAKVDFYFGSTLVGSDYTSPYSYTVANVPVGSYTVTVKASDNTGNSITSNPVTISVVTSQSPVVSITSPVSGTIFPAPASVTINASAILEGGTITKVDFYNGSTLLTSDYASPYSFSVTGVSTGSYTVTAKATDNRGVSTTSAPVIIIVGANKPPVVSITSPVSGAIFAPYSSVTVTASATDPDGTISEVDFYSGGNIIGSDLTSPYSFTGTNVPAGSYSITAKAIDNTGASTTSTPVIVNLSTLKSGILEASTSGNPVNEILAETGNLVCYPVPLTNELNIKFIPVEGENVKAIEIYDEMGKYITNSSRLDTHVVMQLAYLIPGIYIIKVRTNRKTYNKLVIKN